MPNGMIESAASAGAVAAPVVQKYFGESMGFWIQTGAFILSALAAVAVIYYGNKAARKRATVDLILTHAADDKLNRAIKTVHRLHKAKTKLTSLERGSWQHGDVLLAINTMEFVALGIRRGAFDECIYKELQFNDTMRLWDACCSLIHDIRSTESKDTLFDQFEWLARRWKKKPLKKIS